jgi:hypothetical protein
MKLCAGAGLTCDPAKISYGAPVKKDKTPKAVQPQL